MAPRSAEKPQAPRPARRTAPKPKPTTPAPRVAASAARKSRMLAALQRGASVKDGAAYAGVMEATYFSWLARDADFRQAASRARSQGVVEALDVILQVGKGLKRIVKHGAKEREEWLQPPDWRALDRWLQLVRPELYGNRLTIHHEQRVEIVITLLNRLEVAFDAAAVPAALRDAIAAHLLEGLENEGQLLEGQAQEVGP